MRVIAILLNFVLLAAGIYLTIKHGFPKGADDFFIFLLLYATPLASLYVIFGHRPDDESEKGLFALYFERKALEEKSKINKLRSTHGDGA